MQAILNNIPSQTHEDLTSTPYKRELLDGSVVSTRRFFGQPGPTLQGANGVLPG